MSLNSSLLVSCSKQIVEDSEVEKLSFKDYVTQFEQINLISKRVLLEFNQSGIIDEALTVKFATKVVALVGEDYNYLNFPTYIQKSQKDNTDIVDIESIGFSELTLNYFINLRELELASDYIGMIELLEQYKNDYDTDPHLESLAGVFSVIEFHKDDLLLKYRENSDKCGEIDPSGVAGAAISGAITGAIYGFRFGSIFGPAGTALGALGGALGGAIIASIINIGIQGIPCDN
jgi:hypothetical protein